MLDYQHLLQGKRVFISTGARGIGKDIALLFARQGATIAVGARNLKALDKTMEELQAISPASKGYAVDLSHGEETEATANKVLSDFGGIDILVNTVGVNRHHPIHEYDDATMESFLESNYKSGMRLARAFLPGMMQRRDGVIINISSIHSIQTMPGFGLYAGTKGAMNAAARAMALDYAPYGIRVNCVIPGPFPNPKSCADNDGFNEILGTKTMLGRTGVNHEIAGAGLLLASDASSFMTGSSITVDGGWTAW